MSTELDDPFSGVDVAFNLSGEKLVPIHNLPLLNTTQSVGYDVFWSYERLISSETKYWCSLEDVDKLVL